MILPHTKAHKLNTYIPKMKHQLQSDKHTTDAVLFKIYCTATTVSTTPVSIGEVNNGLIVHRSKRYSDYVVINLRNERQQLLSNLDETMFTAPPTDYPAEIDDYLNTATAVSVVVNNNVTERVALGPVHYHLPLLKAFMQGVAAILLPLQDTHTE